MKYEFKGSPAPWVIYKMDTHAGIKTEAPNQLTDIICLAPSPDWHPANFDRWEYDAHLIAAAPDLLRLAVRISNMYVSNLPTDHRDYPVITELREVIHKALNITQSEDKSTG